jgi:hypothetical protein
VRLGAAISLVSLLAVLGLALLPWLRTRRRPSP